MRSARNALVGRQNPLPSPSGITFNSVVPSTSPTITSGGGFVNASWTHTINAGDNCLLVGVYGNPVFTGVPGVSIDSGGPFTLLSSVGYTGFGWIAYALYGLMNPPVGTRTLTTGVFGYGTGGTSIAYGGVSGFAAPGQNLLGSVANLDLVLPAFPGGVAVVMVNGGWSRSNQTARSTAGGLGWQESTVNTASAAATVKGTANAVLGTSVTIPAHAVGDEIVVFAYVNGINAAPTPPAASGTVPAWTLIQGGGGNTNGSGVWRFTATANNHTSGTFTNCTGLIAVVIQGVHPTTPVGGFAQATANANTFSGAPAITQRVTNGSSCLLYFHGHRSNVTTLGAPPTGFTRRAEAIGSSGICLNTKDDTTSDGAAYQTDNGNGGYVGQTVEIQADTGTVRNFSTGWPSAANRHAVGVVLR
jgi:hypothetical protein